MKKPTKAEWMERALNAERKLEHTLNAAAQAQNGHKRTDDAFMAVRRELDSKTAETKRMSEQITDLNLRLTCGKDDGKLLQELRNKNGQLSSVTSSLRSELWGVRSEREKACKQRDEANNELARLKNEYDELQERLDELEPPDEEDLDEPESEPAPTFCELAGMAKKRVLRWLEES